MTPFYTRFPELAARETRCVHVVTPGGALPLGEYGFVELYCEDPGCDCRRVLLQVTTPQSPRTALATINYGWESAEFYTRWMHDDAEAGRQITEASLDPLHPQSQYADHLLEVFREQMMTDPAYVARLARHYDIFKANQRNPTESGLPVPPSVLESPPNPRMTIPEILQQLQRVPDQTDFAPYETALLAASEQREAIAPELIAAIDRVSADPDHYLKDHEECLHLFAIYPLAQFQERRALECFLRFFSLHNPQKSLLDRSGLHRTSNWHSQPDIAPTRRRHHGANVQEGELDARGGGWGDHSRTLWLDHPSEEQDAACGSLADEEQEGMIRTEDGRSWYSQGFRVHHNTGRGGGFRAFFVHFDERLVEGGVDVEPVDSAIHPGEVSVVRIEGVAHAERFQTVIQTESTLKPELRKGDPHLVSSQLLEPALKVFAPQLLFERSQSTSRFWQQDHHREFAPRVGQFKHLHCAVLPVSKVPGSVHEGHL